MAADLTIDELRDRLEQILLKYYRPPLRVIILPQAFHSKKYYLLGNVLHTGVYPLDRPMTLIEAIAASGGFVSTVQRRNTLMLADLERSFVMRRGDSNVFQRISLDFEGLFLRGDLSQNIALAPDDYLFFPPADMREVYVLGRGVNAPGAMAYSPDLTAVRAIAMHGGFADKAWRQRILVVRGSLNAPQTFVVNTADILAARAPDFKLEPKDMVYVSRRPWAKAEELLELAISDFLYGAVTSWTFKNVGPLITQPIIN
jgi:protein involved in polysaccharide export with SLBB domain